MNGRVFGLILVVVVACFATLYCRSPEAAAQGKAKFIQWEYKVVFKSKSIDLDPLEEAEKALNSLGADGWECVGFFADRRVLLKRPKQ